MTQTIHVFSGRDKLFSTKPVAFATNPIILRPYQQEMLDRWIESSKFFSIAPTGSGKSVVIATKAAINYKKGVSTFILIPKVAITGAFDQTTDKNFSVEYNGVVYTLPVGSIKHIIDDDRSALTAALLEKSRYYPAIAVVCYEAFQTAYARAHMNLDSSRLEIVVDEAHHVRADEHITNNLGSLSKQLLTHKVRLALFTATGYRADGGDIVTNRTLFEMHRRTLRDHYDDGWCPDLNVHCRFYDSVAAADYHKYRSPDDYTLVIDNADTLIRAYIDTYQKNPKPTLMIVPARTMSTKTAPICAAGVACQLEKALAARGLNVINLGGYEDKLVSHNRRMYTDNLNQLSLAKKDNQIDVVISIRIMDEGVDWPACSAVYMPRIPLSPTLLMQRIGRSTRPKPQPSDIYLFELAVNGNDQEVVETTAKLACRLKGFFHGFDFVKQSKLIAKIGITRWERLNQSLQRLSIKYHGCDVLPFLSKIQKLCAARLDISLENAIEIAVAAGTVSDQLLVATKKFVKQHANVTCISQDILRDFRVQGPTEYMALLSGATSPTIVDWLKLHRPCTIAKTTMLLELARGNYPKPSAISSKIITIGGTSVVEYELHNTFRMITRRGGRYNTYDHDFVAAITKIRPEWLIPFKGIKKHYCEELEKLAANKSPKPLCSSTNQMERNLANAFRRYTSPGTTSYDPVFHARLNKLCPQWFSGRRTTRRTAAKTKLLKLARCGKPVSRRPTGLFRKFIDPNDQLYDSHLASELRQLQPTWFLSQPEIKKEIIKERAIAGLPKYKFTRLDEKPYANALRFYTKIGHTLYDAAFTTEIKRLRPDWFKGRKERKK